MNKNYILIILDHDDVIHTLRGLYPEAISNKAKQMVILQILHQYHLDLPWFRTRINYKLYTISTPYLFTEVIHTVQLCKGFNPDPTLIQEVISKSEEPIPYNHITLPPQTKHYIKYQ